MPFDGIVAKCVVDELTKVLTGGRVEKVFQPEADEILINIRAWNTNYRLVLSASANYPRIHLTEVSKENPAAPPVFCMLLRKHLSGGKILAFEFNDYERIIGIHVESANELGDISVKKLIIEIMGRHSNIILVNSENKIIDAIKHIDSDISRVREVMPARPYMLPPGQDKTIPESLNVDDLFEGDQAVNISAEKYLLNNIKGFSPLLCREICFRSSVEGNIPLSNIEHESVQKLKSTLQTIITDITNNNFNPCIMFDDEAMAKPLDFHCIELNQGQYLKHFNSISAVLDSFYAARDNSERLRQKKADVYKVANNILDRCNKKLFIQEETMREVADREKLKLYGELITANIYCIPESVKKVSLLNYYSENNEFIEITMDENLSPQENAQRYFKKYSKAKSTYTYTKRQLDDTRHELDYLESVLQLLDNCVSQVEIDEVRQELAEQGYMLYKQKSKGRKGEKPSEPLRFKSSDGLDIFVGKNNRQNDYLTLKLASSNDIWLHTKNIPGSHVIIRKLQHEIPENSIKEAALLAAWHSKAKMSSNVQVDFTTVRNVKKPSGAKPGMVIYENYRTAVVTPDEMTVKKLQSR